MSVPAYLWPSMALAFMLELCALGSFAAWGSHASDRTVTSVALAVAATLAGALVWGMFASPRAPFSVPILTPVVTVAFFGTAALALYTIGHPRLAAGLLAAVVLNTLVLHLAPVSTTSTQEASDFCAAAAKQHPGSTAGSPP